MAIQRLLSDWNKEELETTFELRRKAILIEITRHDAEL